MSTETRNTTLDFKRLMLIMQGHVASQLLWAGVSLRLFDRLADRPGMNLEQIAQTLGLNVYPARVLVTGLSALDVIERVGDGYRNAGLTDELLRAERPGSLVPILGWQAHIVYPGLQDFVASLKEGRHVGLNRFPGSGATLYDRLADPANAPLEEVFQDAMAALSAQANQHLVDAADLSGIGHLVDVGGGNGKNLITLCRKYTTLRGTVFDGPTVCARAREKIAEAGLADRIGTHPGNLFDDPFPADADALLFAHMFTIWSPEDHRRILRKCHDSLPPGGQVLIFNMMTDDDETGPLESVLGSAYFLTIATGQGMLYPWKDYEAALADAGFADVRRVDGLPLSHGLLIAAKAR